MTHSINADLAIDAVVRAWTHKSKEAIVPAVDALLREGRYGEATLQAVSARLDGHDGSSMRSLAADLAGSVVLATLNDPAVSGHNIEVFAIPLTGTGVELAGFGRSTETRRAWAASMARHGLVARHSRVCILPGVYGAHDLLALAPQVIRDLAVTVGTSMVEGHDMTGDPIPGPEPLGAGIQGGSDRVAGVVLAVVLDEGQDEAVIDPLRGLLDYDDESRVESHMPEAARDPKGAWTHAWDEVSAGTNVGSAAPQLPVSIGDAMAAVIEAEIMAPVRQSHATTDKDMMCLAHSSDADGITVEVLIDGVSAATRRIEPALFAACGSVLLDRLDAVTADAKSRSDAGVGDILRMTAS